MIAKKAVSSNTQVKTKLVAPQIKTSIPPKLTKLENSRFHINERIFTPKDIGTIVSVSSGNLNFVSLKNSDVVDACFFEYDLKKI